MKKYLFIFQFLAVVLIAYLFSVSPFTLYAPQIISIACIFIFYYSIKFKKINLVFISFLISLIIFLTNGLNSPVFFLSYFLLFIIAFQSPPSVTLACSLILIIFLSSSLDLSSIITLCSLLLITPLAWFVGHQYLEKQKTDDCITRDETAFLFWLKLKFKTGITKIIDSASILQSQPQLSPTQKEEVKFIKDSAKNLLNSSDKLSNEIEHSEDEI